MKRQCTNIAIGRALCRVLQIGIYTGSSNTNNTLIAVVAMPITAILASIVTTSDGSNMSAGRCRELASAERQRRATHKDGKRSLVDFVWAA